MLDFLLLLFIFCDSFSSKRKDIVWTTLTHSNGITKSFSKKSNEYICTSATEISDETFNNFVTIKSGTNCQSIKIKNCVFDAISSENIILSENSELYIEKCHFFECTFSKSIVNCMKNDALIDNCIFSNNGFDNSESIILLKDANNVLFSFSSFENSPQRMSSAIESWNTKNINLTFCTFKQMMGKVDQCGGAISIHFSENVALSNSVFDSNNLQKSSENLNEISGSAFFANLNFSFIFVNNTIKNHENFLNSVVTFNMKDSQSVNEVVIKNSCFINNKYSESIDGSGIGFLAENENDSDQLNIAFIECLFEKNGDSTTNEIENSAGVFGLSKKLTSLSFVDCYFDSNLVQSSSSLINIQNGYFLSFENCSIKENVGYSLIKFSPLTIEDGETLNINEIQVQIINLSITGLTDRVSNDIILIENDTKFNSSLILDNCTFSDVSLNTNNYVIHAKSNLNLVCVNNSKICNNDLSKGSNLMKYENSNINFLNIKNCIFEKSYYVISSEITVKEAVISNCTFTDCVSDTSNLATITINSDNFLCENCDLVFTSHSNGACSMGIFISESITAVINNVNFKYCLGLQEGCAIRCLSQNIQSTDLTVKSCNFDECTQQMSNVYTTNRELNFINNTITSESVNNNLKGLLINYMCHLFIDECMFTRCSYNSDSTSSGSSIRYNPSTYDESIDESIIIQNCCFTECVGYGAAAGLNPFVSRPKFYNITILKSYHNFNFIIVMQSSTSTAAKEPDEVLLQNVSFIDCHPKGDNAGVGGGGCGFWYQTAISTEDSVSFIGCRFVDNNYHGADVTKYGGGAISIQSTKWSHFHIKISSCSFYNCYTSANNGGAVAINTKKSVQIEDSYFENCRIENNKNFDYKGGAIYINQVDEINPFYIINTTFNNTIACSDCSAIGFNCFNCNEFIINNCSFLNCITRCYKNLPYNIFSCPLAVKRFSCIDTNFIFDEKSASNPRVAKIESPIFSFNNCQFIRCGSKLIDNGGALFYDGTYSYEDVSISDCNFDECDAIDSSSFKLKFNSNVNPTFRNITFSNTNSSFNIYITYKISFRGRIQLERLRFINNTNYSEGGGSGIWVSNFQDSYNSLSIRLNFLYCEFINNYTPLNGGGYGVGVNEAIEPTYLSFTSCNFIGNHCDGTDGGGALWIRTSLSCTISSCTFKNNYASEQCQSNGGALYLSFTSNMIFMTLNSCVFDNNSCPYLNSKGHAIYSTLLYGRMEVSYSNLTDNGNGVDYPNSIIYSRSELNVIESHILFRDKKKAFSRAIYAGGSSDLELRGCVIVNCSIKEKGGASLYYESIKNKNSGIVEIIGNTFINNTSKEKGLELYLIVNNSPRVSNYNCTFINESAKYELIYIRFIHQPIISERYDRFYFINCDFNHKHFISKEPFNQDEMIYETLILFNCRYISCTNISLFFTGFYSVRLTSCVFEGNINDGNIININNIEEKSIIRDCEFRNNALVGNNLDENNEFSLINASHISLTITNTVFERTIQKEMPKYAVFYSPSKGEQSYFDMNNCNISNNGIVFIDGWTKEISVVNTSFSNSVNGFHYSIESLNDYVSDVFKIENVVFDNFSNCACLLSVSNDMNITNITIKNCQNIEENCVSIFQIDIKNDLINYFTFNDITFENNRFNSKNNDNWMNGGIGLLFNLNEKHKEFFLNFVDCNFISNYAEDYGGAFAIIESDERTTFLNFDSCYFNENSCNKEGKALYLIVKNLSINNCIFDQKSSITEREVGSMVYIQSIPMNGLSNLLSLNNCSFINNNECSLNIHNSLSELFILDCLFINDKDYLSEDTNNRPLYINIEECEKDLVVSDSTFETYKKKNKDINLIYSKTNSVTIKNNIFKGNENENDYAISSCCSNIILIENNKIFDTGGIYIFPDSNIITLTKTIINNTNYGLFFKPNNILHSITIIECTFSSIMHALLLKLIKNDNFILKNNTICDCNNFDEKTSIIEITINAFVNLQFEEFIFYNNQYSQPQTKSTGFGGGIGLNIFSTNKLQEFKLEFKNCIFSSNSANQKEGINDYNSGGSLYYVNDNNITLSELSINACNFTENYAKQKGGSLYIETGNKSPIIIKKCCFIMNKAEIDCGAVYIKNGAEFKMYTSQFINNSVSTTSSSSLISADSLYIFSNANAIVSNSIFVKLSFSNEITNIQTIFSISNRYSNQEISILIKNSLYSVINPSKSIVVLQNPNQKGIITIDNTSFTHFFTNNESSSSTTTSINKMNEDVPQMNESIKYVHVFILSDLIGKINFDNSCFDTESIYSNDYEAIGLNIDDKEINNELISMKNNIIDNYQCEHPSIVDEFIDQIFFTTTLPNKRNLKLLIGLVVGIFSLILIIVVIALICAIKKKKEKEEEKRKEIEKEKEMTMELDAIQNKFNYATQAITQENPLFTFSNVNNDHSEDEETDKIQTTKV